MKTKTCTKCGVKYPATAEYFYINKMNKDDFRGRCKQCMKKYQIAWRKRNPRYHKKYSKVWRGHNPQYDKNYRATLRGFTKRLHVNIRHRCDNVGDVNYIRYGGRGIRCIFTEQELYDWFVENNIDPRGKNVHRINNDDNYTLNNIISLSHKDHAKAHRILRGN